MLQGKAPVGWLFKTEHQGDRIVRGQTVCSGTLVAPDVVATASHCLIPFLQPDGSIEVKAPYKLHMIFSAEPKRSDPHYLVTKVYHQIPRAGTKGFLAWLGFTSPRGNPDGDSITTMVEHDVALLKLAAPVQDVTPATVEAFDKDRKATYSVAGYGVSAYLRFGDAVVDRTVGIRNSLAIDKITSVKGAVYQGSFPKPATDDGKLRSVDGGDSGGFVGQIGETYVLNGIISQNHGNAASTRSGSLPFIFRAIDTKLIQWMETGKQVLAKAETPFATAVALSDYGTVALESFPSLLPSWARQGTPTAERRLTDFGVTDPKQGKVKKLEREIPNVGKLFAAEVTFEGKWHGEKFNVLVTAFTRTGAESDRLVTALTDNLKTKGLPPCFANDATAWLVANGTRRMLVFVPNREWKMKIADGREIPMSGLTSCADAAAIY